MKIVAYVILLAISFSCLQAQTESIPFDISGNAYDSTYNYLEGNSYTLLNTDTLEFHDGSKVYRIIKVKRGRPDTTMKTESASYNFNADTVNETLTYPIYSEKLKKLRFPVVDTIRDPSDPTKYGTKKTDSIEIDYAKSYPLDKEIFSQTIKKIERIAELQGLHVEAIYLRIYPDNGEGSDSKVVDEEDFRDVDFISTTFLFEKDELMMEYPIIFE